MSDLLVIKTFHLLGFAGCLSASFFKNLLLRRPAIEGPALSRLVGLDKLSGGSSVVILATGILMAGWFAKPTGFYLHSPLFWGKVTLFTLASAAILTTKPLLRRAKAEGVLRPAPRERLVMMFDFGSILVIAMLGLSLARALA